MKSSSPGPTVPAKHGSGPERSRRQVVLRELPWAVAVVVICATVAVWSLRLWQWHPGTPLDLAGDSPFVAMQLRDIHDHGWYWLNPDLAYPAGQNGSLFPELNVVHVAIVKVLGLLFTNAYTPGVAYFVVGFPLAGLTAYLLGRHLGIARPAAVVLGVLFANAPGHQESFEHLWLAAYWTVPIALWLVLTVAAGRPLLRGPDSSGGIRAWLSPRSVMVVVALTIVGLSGAYYVAFTMVLLVVATLGRRLASGRPGDWLPGLGAALYLAAVILVPLLAARAGASGDVIVGAPPAQRSFHEAELYAGKLMDLLLPWPGHRVDALAQLSFAYNSGSRPTVEIVALGVVAAVGFIGLGIGVLRHLFSGAGQGDEPRRWAVLAGASFAFYTVGGLGSLTALFVTPTVRTWSRISIFIMLLGLLAVARWLTRLERVRGRAAAWPLCVVVLVVGVLDQTNPDRAPDHEATNARWAAVRQYAADLAERTSPGCGVFQLPVVNFPESQGVRGMTGYDQLLPFLGSSGLRWSSGAMRGTAASTWQAAVDLGHPEQLAGQLAAAGFCALEVNTKAFDTATDPRTALQAALGAPIAQSPDGVHVAYGLRSGSSVEGDAERLLHPVLVALDAYELRRREDGLRQWLGPYATLRVVNLHDEAVPLTIRLKVRAEGTSRELRVADEAGAELLRASLSTAEAGPVGLSMVAQPGVSRLRISLSGDPVRLRDPRIWVSAEATALAVSSPHDVRVASYMEQVANWVAVP